MATAACKPNASPIDGTRVLRKGLRKFIACKTLPITLDIVIEILRSGKLYGSVIKEDNTAFLPSYQRQCGHPYTSACARVLFRKSMTQSLTRPLERERSDFWPRTPICYTRTSVIVEADHCLVLLSCHRSKVCILSKWEFARFSGQMKPTGDFTE